ncbi:MAG: hypothetical protein WA734_06055 [Candidatus Acidiferrales bacterium]
MKRRKKRYINLLALTAMTPLFWMGIPASAQSAPDQNNPPAQPTDQNNNPIGRPAPPVQPVHPDNAITEQELARFDQFLDSHPEVAERLRRDPSLVDNNDFLRSHPELQNYLQDHPAIRQELEQHPNEFMRREERFERREDRDRDADRRDNDNNGRRDDADRYNNDNGRRDEDATRQELARFNDFLQTHPEIAEQLRKDPSLVDNREFVDRHPALQTYLHDHPAIREQIKSDPNAFMREEDRYERHDNGRGEDINRDELAHFDQFLDQHREIAEQLRRDPSLVDNREWVDRHPALQSYLKDHPAIRQEIKENPNAFMRQEDRFQDRDAGMGRDFDRRAASFGEFLGGHSNLSQQLANDPTLVKNDEYMANHPELRDYLQQHPDVKEDLMANPQSFVKSAQKFSNNGQPMKTPTGDTRPKQ